MVIVQVNNRFFVETNGQRLHILNWRSLEWNLKHVFKMPKTVIRQVGDDLMVYGRVELALTRKSAA